MNETELHCQKAKVVHGATSIKPTNWSIDRESPMTISLKILTVVAISSSRRYMPDEVRGHG